MMKWSCLPEICQSCIYSHHRAAQITVIKLQLAEGELSATVLMVCSVGNDIWSGRARQGRAGHIILPSYFRHIISTYSGPSAGPGSHSNNQLWLYFSGGKLVICNSGLFFPPAVTTRHWNHRPGRPTTWFMVPGLIETETDHVILCSSANHFNWKMCK